MLDLSAGINILMGLGVAALELCVWRECKTNRWIYLFKAASGLFLAVIFAHALLFNGGTVDPSIGRPAVTLVLGSLAMGAILQRRRGC